MSPAPLTVLFEAECSVTGHPRRLYAHGSGSSDDVLASVSRDMEVRLVVRVLAGHHWLDGEQYTDSSLVKSHLRMGR